MSSSQDMNENEGSVVESATVILAIKKVTGFWEVARKNTFTDLLRYDLFKHVLQIEHEFHNVKVTLNTRFWNDPRRFFKILYVLSLLYWFMLL